MMNLYRHSNCMLFYKKMYLFICKSEYQREGRAERHSSGWFTSWMASIASTEPGQSQKPRAPFGSPTRMSGDQAHGPSSASLPGPLTCNWLSSRATKVQTTPTWDADIPDTGFIWNTTTSTLVITIFKM